MSINNLQNETEQPEVKKDIGIDSREEHEKDMIKQQRKFALIGLIIGLVIGLIPTMVGYVSSDEDGNTSNTSSSVSSLSDNENVVGTAQIDLNGDNLIDRIALSIVKDDVDIAESGSHPILIINDIVLDINQNNPVGYLGIVDLDVNDGKHEIALSDFGPSTDFTTRFYTYDGSIIKFLGETEGLYEHIQFNGDGSLVTTTRAHVLDTWFYRDAFAYISK